MKQKNKIQTLKKKQIKKIESSFKNSNFKLETAQKIKGVGLSARPLHFKNLLKKQDISWLELIADHYLICNDDVKISVQKLSEIYPIVFHCLGLSVGSSEPVNKDYLKKIKELKKLLKPAWISDHLCWTSNNGNHFFDLLPFPMTEEIASHVAKKILIIQDFFGEPLLLENISSYISFNHSTLSEIEFFTFLFNETKCLMLLDLNNLYVNSQNNDTSPEKFLRNLSKNQVQQIHLAGFKKQGNYLVDTHSESISKGVWTLYKKALKIFGKIPTSLEWDEKIPSFKKIMNELKKIKSIYNLK